MGMGIQPNKTTLIKYTFILFMNLQYSVYYWDLSAFYPEDNNLSNSDWILYPVGQKQEVSSVESWLHTSTEIQKMPTLVKLATFNFFKFGISINAYFKNDSFMLHSLYKVKNKSRHQLRNFQLGYKTSLPMPI